MRSRRRDATLKNLKDSLRTSIVSQTSSETSTGTPERSGAAPDPRRLPRVRTPEDLQPSGEFEQQVFDALDQEFGRLDGSARASAKFERHVYDELRQQRLAEGWTEEDAGDLQEVFDRDWFARCTADLAVTSMTSRLIRLFGLDQYHDAIMPLIISGLFAPQQHARTKEVFVGHETHALTKQLRDRRAAR